MLTKEEEMSAFHNEPMPRVMTPSNKIAYMAIQYISRLLEIKAITGEEAKELKTNIYKQLADIDKAHALEIRCWENAAKRTMSACHRMMAYRMDKTIENADRLYDALEWLSDEVVFKPEKRDGKLYCVTCNALVDDSMAFCGHCGQKLKLDAEIANDH